MIKNEGCLLWERGKALANDRRLTIHGECPVLSHCDGSFCFYISPVGDFGPKQLEDFQTRLEKHFDELERRKLQALREELKTIDDETKNAYSRAFPKDEVYLDPLMKASPEDIDRKGGPMA